MYLDASLFFSFLVFGRTLKGSSETGAISLMTFPSLSSSLPIKWSFLGFGVKSFPSPFLAFPLCFIPRTEQLGLKTGSVTSFSTWGSSSFVFKTNLWPFGPFACTLYCQKYLSFLESCCFDNFSFPPPSPSLDSNQWKKLQI